MQKYIGSKPKKFLHNVEETWNNTLKHESHSGLYEEPEKNVRQAGRVVYIFHMYAFDKLSLCSIFKTSWQRDLA